ncbi:hypothetical protein CMP1-05 [Clavibacter phage CMP1]|uniref:Uncharacterized protein n=1 Tax=Clavibacter phage CMP1 TaxID=686439 RepID=D0U1Y9_9CAUD|nr:hypothetical protein CMP1-05 [Clavibacter phage CMP1]ACY35901.1 hypothetical protein CMP1-05 [Clavibacter phage CMP1]
MELGQFLHEQFNQAVKAWKDAATAVPIDGMRISRALEGVSNAKKALDDYHAMLKYIPMIYLVINCAWMGSTFLPEFKRQAPKNHTK